MKQLIKTIATIIIAALVVVVIRTYFYTVSTVTADLGQTLRSGDRVLVNKVGKHTFRRGDLMVFHPADWPATDQDSTDMDPRLQAVAVDSTSLMIGQVTAVPGDTILMRHGRYVIPVRCCERCGSLDCKLYLVTTGKGRQLVHLHQVVGSAHRIFHLPW